MELDHVQIRGAREHNLRGIDVSIPKKKLVVFTGVSGYSQERAGGRFGQPGLTAFLQKPFLPSMLLSQVLALLDA